MKKKNLFILSLCLVFASETAFSKGVYILNRTGRKLNVKLDIKGRRDRSLNISNNQMGHHDSYADLNKVVAKAGGLKNKSRYIYSYNKRPLIMEYYIRTKKNGSKVLRRRHFHAEGKKSRTIHGKGIMVVNRTGKILNIEYNIMGGKDRTSTIGDRKLDHHASYKDLNNLKVVIEGTTKEFNTGKVEAKKNRGRILKFTLDNNGSLQMDDFREQDWGKSKKY